MDFSWSTPLRRNGQNNLPLIPNEIYLAIFDCIAPSSIPLPEKHIKTFSALALVCRFFCAVALPRVFERVAFLGNNTIGTDRMQACGKTTWARQIVANTEPARSIALYVKECHFQDWHALYWSVFTFSTLYCRAMARMTNIRKLEFYRSFVKKEHWETMEALKQLDCLHFILCSFTENPPYQELSVRVVKLFSSLTPHILWPIATSTLRTLETDNLEAVLKLVTARQLAITNFVLRYTDFELKMLLQVFEQLPDLESIAIGFSAKEAVSPLISGLSLKKFFTRLRSFTINVSLSWGTVPQHAIVKLLSAICDGPGTLPSLENLDLSFFGGVTPTLDIGSNYLESTIIPAFPNLKYVRTPDGDMRLEKGGWKRSHILKSGGSGERPES